jgi:hypothetical protein
MKDVIASHQRYICLFERVRQFLERLKTYTNVALQPAMIDLLGKIMSQVLSILAVSTKELQARRISEPISFSILHLPDYEIERFLDRLMGRTEVEDALQRLDVLTGDELRMVVANILEVAHRVDRNVAVATEVTRDVGNRMTRVEAITRTANRNMRSAYAGV